MENRGQWVLYGLEKVQEAIEGIIDMLNLQEWHFEIKLLLIEGITNAYYHGNRADVDKPIYIRCSRSKCSILMEIEDCGCGVESLDIPTETTEDLLWMEHGRGLLIISNLADSVEFYHNTLYIKKTLVQQK